jgi:hypothetical protein
MTSYIHYRKQGFFVANKRFSALIDFALEFADGTAQSDAERAFVSQFRADAASFWNGIDLDLEAQFPTLEQQKFWATCFFDLGRHIFLRKIGNQDVTFWQSSTICDAHLIGRMLTEVVRQVENGWVAETADGDEAQLHYESLTVRR